MSNTIKDNTESFESKMKSRIKDSIGELITDDELSRLIKASIEDVFFKPTTKTGRNSWENTTVEPLMHSIIKDCLTEQVRSLAQEWINDNPEKVNSILEELIRDGAGNVLIKSFGSLFEQQLINFKFDVQNNISNNIMT